MMSTDYIFYDRTKDESRWRLQPFFFPRLGDGCGFSGREKGADESDVRHWRALFLSFFPDEDDPDATSVKSCRTESVDVMFSPMRWRLTPRHETEGWGWIKKVLRQILESVSFFLSRLRWDMCGMLWYDMRWMHEEELFCCGASFPFFCLLYLGMRAWGFDGERTCVDIREGNDVSHIMIEWMNKWIRFPALASFSCLRVVFDDVRVCIFVCVCVLKAEMGKWSCLRSPWSVCENETRF